MKKFFKLLVLVLLIAIANSGIASAEIKKNFYGYQVKDVKVKQLGNKIDSAIAAYKGDDSFKPLENVNNAYIYTDPNCTYYVKLYPANQNTNIYVVSNEKYDVEKNALTDFLTDGGYKIAKLEDKAALKEYQFDFYSYARKQKLGNFYISPDLVKPIKSTVKKINNKMAKNNKKTAVFPYAPDKEPINLDCVDTTSYYDEKAKIDIKEKEYRLKQKENKYVHAYEYVLTNKNKYDATVTVTSERVAGLKDIATESFVDIDRIDMIDSIGSFPPVLIMSAGTSLILCVPHWIRLAKITAESKRYAKALPENYELKQQADMRLLVLKYKDDPKPLKFNIKFADGTVHNITF